ncbi:MAG: hypothetical protein HWE26_15700 [Alteromonadaceae bacterium]|nr:hypothetical protein [Alteromonadaceae bacterium]
MKYGIAALLTTLGFVAGFFAGQYLMPATDHNINTIKPTTEAAQLISEPDTVASFWAGDMSSQTEPEARSITADAAQPPASDRLTPPATPSETPDASKPVDVAATLAQVERKLAMEKFPMAQEEMEYWLDNHNRDLKDSMREKLGDSADWMFEEVSKNNALLNNPIASSPLEQDLAWRQQAKQQLSDLIYSLNTDPGFELVSVTCIQKQCEVTITGEDQSAATRLFIQVVSRNDIGISGASTPTFHSKYDDYWLYFTVQFT